MTRTTNLGAPVLTKAFRAHERRGSTLILAAFFLVGLLGLLAFSIDLGYIMTAQAELDRAVDAAALAGAGSLVDGEATAQATAFEFFAANPVGGQLLLKRDNWEEKLTFETQMGHWNPDTRTFTQSNNLPSAITVSVQQTGLPLFFANVFGHDKFSISSEAVARYLPRDIALVLDFSGSMNDDSELQRIAQYGNSERSTIEANLQQIYEELGSPTYGDMQFQPQYISSNDNNTIKEQLGLRYQEDSGSSGGSGWGWGWGGGWGGGWGWGGGGSSGGGEWKEVPYPYPSGSWDDYINYVKTSSYIRSAGYQKKYGYMTLINYWLEKQPKYSQTPDLWKVSAQPVQAVKDSVNVFMEYIQAVDCEDHVSLVIYDSPSEDALVEHHLTGDFDSVQETVTHRQAAHYASMTNIGAGIREARLELKNNARVGAFKMIVLMTDGQANKPNNTSYARQYALDQAQLAADEGYPIVTISLGNGADKNLMEQIAEISGGVHFNVEAGQAVEDYEDELLGVFRQIADDRPLILVK